MRRVILLLLVFVLAPLTAFADDDGGGAGFLSPVVVDAALTLLGTIGTVVLGIFVRNKWISQTLNDAISAAGWASRQGVRVAAATYTEAIKKARADGKLTEEEKAHARKLAFDAAVASLGANGLKLLQAGFKDGWEKALQTTIEGSYAAQRPFFDPAKPAPAAASLEV